MDPDTAQRFFHLTVLAVTFSVYVLVATPCHAQQITTNITSTTGVGDLGTTVTPNGVTHTITGGIRPNNGSNLFHSFENFSVGTSDIANFNNETGLPTESILSRVTGMARSEIDGLIRTTGFSGADLFLINPAGVMFGSGASLDIQGSFHVGTADSIKLADGVQFNAMVPSADDTLLSTAPPEAFGFLDRGGPASITVNGSDLRLPAGESLSLVASENVLVSSGVLDVPGGNIDLVHTSVDGESSINRTGPGESTQDPGNLELPPEFDEKDVLIRSGTFTVSGVSARVGQAESDITVNVNTFKLLDGGRLQTSDSSSDPADIPEAGDIRVHAGKSASIITGTAPVESQIRADVLIGREGNPNGNAGRVQVVTPALEIDGGRIVANAFLGGTAGEIRLEVDTLELRNGAIVETFNNSDQPGGTVEVVANNSVLITGQDEANPTGLSSGTLIRQGDAGRVRVQSPQLEIRGPGASISTQTEGEGNAGMIELEIRKLAVHKGGFISSDALQRSRGGNAGLVSIRAESVDIRGGTVSTRTVARGNAGEIEFTDVGQLTVSENGLISSDTSGPGNGGLVSVQAGRVDVVQGGEISTSTEGFGEGGQIVIKATDHVNIANQGRVVASTQGTGKGGNINLSTSVLEIHDGGTLSAESASTGLNLGDNPDQGKSGTITIDVSDTFRIFSGSAVSVETRQANAGDIDLDVGFLLHLRDNSRITTSASGGDGDGGDIRIDPVFVVLDGGSQITARASRGGGGNINILTDFLFQSPDSVIDASSDLGVDGNVEIQSPDSDVIAGTLALPESFLNVSTLLGDRCAARAVKDSSSFVIGGRGGVPPGPETVLPSHVFDLGQGSLRPKGRRNGDTRTNPATPIGGQKCRR